MNKLREEYLREYPGMNIGYNAQTNESSSNIVRFFPHYVEWLENRIEDLEYEIKSK